MYHLSYCISIKHLYRLYYYISVLPFVPVRLSWVSQIVKFDWTLKSPIQNDTTAHNEQYNNFMLLTTNSNKKFTLIYKSKGDRIYFCRWGGSSLWEQIIGLEATAISEANSPVKLELKSPTKSELKSPVAKSEKITSEVGENRDFGNDRFSFFFY